MSSGVDIRFITALSELLTGDLVEQNVNEATNQGGEKRLEDCRAVEAEQQAETKTTAIVFYHGVGFFFSCLLERMAALALQQAVFVPLSGEKINITSFFFGVEAQREKMYYL